MKSSSQFETIRNEKNILAIHQEFTLDKSDSTGRPLWSVVTKIHGNHACVKFLTYDSYGHHLAASYPKKTIVRNGSDVPILTNLVSPQATSPCHPLTVQLLTPFAAAPRLASACGF